MFVANALLVDSHTRNRQDAIFFTQPARVELVVRYNPKEDQAQAEGEQTRYQEDDLPRLDGGPVLLGPDCDAVGDESAEDLAYSVEAEPNVDSDTLFLFGIPLRSC